MPIDQWTASVPPSVQLHPSLKKKRKNFSEKTSEECVQDIFGTIDPPIISPVELQRYVDLQGVVKTPPMKISSPKTLIGIEVEVENVLYINPNIPLLMWAIKEDGSLRNRGREFVTPGVIPVSYAEPALNLLFSGLNPDIDFSSRTSIHVHMDVRQFTLQQMVAFLLVYTTVENLLFKFVGNNRRTNIFCVPITETSIMENMALNPKKFIHSIEGSWSKYTALNLLPVASQGSVEFRHMPGTSDVRTMVAWIDMLCRIKTFIYKRPYGDIVDRILQLNSNSMYRQYVEEIFGDLTGYLDTTNLLQDMEKPVYLAKHCAAANAFNARCLQPSEQSQLAIKLGGWLMKLPQSQRDALTKIANELIGNTDLEAVFQDLLERHAMYIKTYPGWKDIILQAMGTKKEGKAKAPTTWDEYLQQIHLELEPE